MPNVWLSLGSNINRHENIEVALRALAETFGALRVSKVYESVAVGFSGDPFFNLVVGIETELPIDQLSTILRAIEDQKGRVRGGERFAPRTLDIDLLTYGDTVTDQPVELPRDEIMRFAFVLLPLSEIAGQELHPELGRDYATLWREAALTDQELWPIEFDLSAYDEV